MKKRLTFRAMKKRKIKIISQADAADIRGVSRQAIHKLSRKVWSFFRGEEIDANHPDWKLYLDGKRPEKIIKKAGKKKTVKSKAKKKPIAKKKKTVGKKAGKKKQVSNKKTPKVSDVRQKHSDNENVLTGGIDLKKININGLSLRDIKTLTDISKLNIEMRLKLGELIERKLVEDRLLKLSNLIQSGFVDLSRRVSSKIAMKLKRVGMERAVEKIIGDEVKKSIRNIKDLSLKNLDDSKK